MSWCAVSPLRSDDGSRAPSPARMPELLDRGTILMELNAPLRDRRLALLEVAAEGQMPYGLTILRDEGGTIALETGPADAPLRAEIKLGWMERVPALRIMLTWNKARLCLRLWVSAPGHDATPRGANLRVAMQIATGGLLRSITDPSRPGCAREVDFLALSTIVEPVGPMPGLASGTMLHTPAGPRRIDSLTEGEEVVALDRAGQAVTVPVLACLRHRLPARGAFRPVQLYAPFFGLTSDTYLGANEHLTLSGPDVEYLFSQERVLVPARCLVSSRTGRWPEVGDTVIWYQLLLPGQEQLRIAKSSVASLHVGQLRRSPEAHERSLVASVPRRALPHHGAPAHPVLTEFEAATLLDQLSR